MRLKFYPLTLLLLCNLYTINAQNNAFSTSWRRTIGSPEPSIDWFTSALDNNGNTLMAGNTLTSNGEDANFLITKLDKQNGDVIWEVEWNYSTFNGNDYSSGIAIYDDEVFVCGVASGPTGGYMLVVIQLDLNDGSLVWEYVYNNSSQLYTIPSAIIAESGSVFVTGATTSIMTASDYLTIRLNSNDGSENWSSIYDYNSQFDAGLKIAFQSGSVVVTGASGISLTKAEITAIKYNKMGGALLSSANIPNPGNYLDEPTDIATDNDGNVFICGKFHDVTNGTDIKVIKLDASLMLEWSYQWDGNSDDDVPNAIALDFNGNAYVTGYTNNSVSLKEMITLAIDESGNQLWEKRKLVEPLYDETAGVDIEFAHNNLIALGYVLYGTNKNLITYSYDITSGFPKWIFELQDNETTSELPSNLKILNENSVMLTAMQTAGTIKSYLSTRIMWVERDREPYFDTNNKPLYAANEVIIRFNPSVLNNTTINNKDLEFGRLSQFISNSLLNQINSRLQAETKDFLMFKIFPWLTTNNNTSIARDGVEREIPPFYSWLNLTLPQGMDPLWVCEELSDIPGIVNMSVNQIAELAFTPEDALYSEEQFSLHNSPLLSTGSVYDIGMETAWDTKTGVNYTDNFKPIVGVYDTGVRFSHEDLQSIIGQTVSGGLDIVVGGSTTIFDIGDPAPDGHGTAVSGIISATTNNNVGISGIAGGDGNAAILESLPVELQVNRIFNNSGELPNYSDELMWAFWDDVAEAQLFSALSIFLDHPVTVINQSYTLSWLAYGEEWGVLDEFSQINRTLFNQ
jgi:outer membrane protein assembly factor BamB